MNNKYLEPIDCHAPEADRIDRAVDFLLAGKIIVVPTETRYGLMARADKEEVITQLFHLKNRSSAQPTAVFIGSVPMMMHYVRLNPVAQRLASIFLPGPLTLVLPALEGITYPVVYQNTLGIRVSSSPVVQAIMQRVNFPVTATSANISGDNQDTNINAIYEIFDEQVALYLDGGELNNQPSTIVDCTHEQVRILREGGIPAEEIYHALGKEYQ